MQSFSAMNFTTTGGSILARGWSPSASSSRWNGLHHLLSVFRLTPALSASCCFDIAFIIYGLELQIIDKISSWFWKMWLRFSHRFAFGERFTDFTDSHKLLKDFPPNFQTILSAATISNPFNLSNPWDLKKQRGLCAAMNPCDDQDPCAQPLLMPKPGHY